MTNHLFDGLLGNARPDRPLAFLDDGSVRSCGWILDRSARYANVLTRLGVAPGDRVAAQIRKSVEALALYLACVRSGAVFLPLNTAYTANEVGNFLDDAHPRVFVCDPASAESMSMTAARSETRIETLGVMASEGSLAEAAKGAAAEFENAPRSASDIAAILYTSGTTGRSKGAMLSHENLLSNALVLKDYWRFTEDDVLLHILPIFHTHGLFVATNVVLVSGASMIFLPGFDTQSVIKELRNATVMMGVPTNYTRLLDDPAFTKDAAAHMRLFVSGSAPLLAETHARFHERTGHRILERYGMTETNMNTSNPYDGERRAGTVGFPLPGVDLRICDPETGAEVAKGQVGVIEVKGPNVFRGYWNMPKKTAEEFRSDGFFVTGDMARFDEDGYIHIIGRAKDLIISGGYNIYPKEIELLLDAQDGVKESAVIGAPHPDFGESPVAVIVCEPGANVDADRLLDAIRPQIARFKQPRKIFTVAELPRNTMGKVQKNILREKFKDAFSKS